MPVSEIITVEETDVNGKQYTSGKWQKMEKPYAFTGDVPESPSQLQAAHVKENFLVIRLPDSLSPWFIFIERSLCHFSKLCFFIFY